jgi:class 3 adenylate cyclase
MSLVFKDSPKVEKGVLNLIFWNFEKQGAINLEGNWEIYWKKIYRPNTVGSFQPESFSGYYIFPSLWKGKLFKNEIADGNGYATFRVKILLPDNYNKKQKLALRMKEQSTAYELYLDNELFAYKGHIGTTYKDSVPGYGANTVYFETEKKSIDLVLIVSNYHHRSGGIWSIPILGTHEQIQYLKYERNSLEFLLGGSILIMTIYHFMLFIFRKNDLSSLYFALFCLTTLMRIISTGEIMLVQLFPSIPYELVTKFEYFSFYLFTPLFFKFFKELFPKDISDLLVKISVTIGGVLGMIVCLSNLRIYNNFVDFNYAVILITIAIVYYYQVKVIIKGREDSITLFLSTNILIFFTLNDIFYNLEFLRTSEFIQIGVFIFLMAQSVILSRRFSLAFRDIEILSSHLSIVNNAYSNFVPKEFLKILNRDNITDVQLGDLVKTEITILFSGIRDFTSISEKFSSEEIFDLLNQYYKGVTSIIRKNKGFIDKFIGDEIIVLFPESPEHAMKTSTDIIKYLETFNQIQERKGKLTFKIGIGIHTGQVTLGTLGGKERMDTTVIGNAVGIAKKMESLTKVFLTPVIFSSDTYSILEKKSKGESREIDHLNLKGNEGFITIYEYFGGDAETIKEQKKAMAMEYFRALALYRGGFLEKAKDLFFQCQKQIQDDSISSFYISRCDDSLLENTARSEKKKI